MTVPSLHMADRPVRDFFSQTEGLGFLVCKKGQSVDGLRSALNVYGLGLVAVVLWASVRLNEMSREIVETATKIRLEVAIPSAIDIALQAVQIVARVKVVDP